MVTHIKTQSGIDIDVLTTLPACGVAITVAKQRPFNVSVSPCPEGGFAWKRVCLHTLSFHVCTHTVCVHRALFSVFVCLLEKLRDN